MTKAQKPFEITIALKLRADSSADARAMADKLVANFKAKGVPAEWHSVQTIREDEMR